MGAEPILFTIFGILALGSAVCVIAFKNPIHSALALVLTFFSLAGLFIVLGAHFVAAVQVIVYAGAIMVLFLFVIMLLNLGTVQVVRQNISAVKVFAVILGLIFAVEGVYIGANVYNGTAIARVQQGSVSAGGSITQAQLDALKEIEALYQLAPEQVNHDYAEKLYNKTDVTMLTASEADKIIKTLQQEMGKVDRIGSVLFSRFLLPFEVTSLILLAALIGVIVLVKREGPRVAA